MLPTTVFWFYTFLVLLVSVPTTTAFAVWPARSSSLLQKQKQQQPWQSTTTTTTTTTTPLHMAGDDDNWSPSKSAMIGGAGVSNAGEPPFEIRGFSLGNLVVGLGLLVTVASFAEYLGDTTDSSLSSSSSVLGLSGLGFVYGIPIVLAGAALKYAEIDPVPVVSATPDAETRFDAVATDTMRKIKQDVTRHRYGDEAHLDTTVKKLGLVVPGKAYPQLQELRQAVAPNGVDVQFTMVWQSLDTPYKMWADERRVQKYQTFFGPDITAQVIKIDAEQRLVGIQLTTLTGPQAPPPSPPPPPPPQQQQQPLATTESSSLDESSETASQESSETASQESSETASQESSETASQEA